MSDKQDSGFGKNKKNNKKKNKLADIPKLKAPELKVPSGQDGKPIDMGGMSYKGPGGDSSPFTEVDALKAELSGKFLSRNSLASLPHSEMKAKKVGEAKSDGKAKIEGPKYSEPMPTDSDLYAENSGTAKSESDYDIKPNKEHQFSLRYRIPKKLSKLDKSKLRQMSHYVDEQMRLGDDQRTEFLIRLAQWRDAWTNFMKTGVMPGFKGGHDVHIPMIFEKVRTMHSRIYQAVLSIDPMFSIKPRSVVSEEQKQTREDLLRWATNDYANKTEGWAPTLDQDIWNFVADGTSISKHFWVRDVRKSVNVVSEEKRPLELDAHGQPVMNEREVEEESIVYDGPMFKTVRLEDIYIVGNYVDSLDDADLIVHRQQYTRSDLIKLAKLGFFEEEALECVLKKEPDSTYLNSLMGNDNLLKNVDDWATGVDKSASLAGIKTYTIHESYFRYDIDDDGIDEELVAWIEESTGEVLRITYLERVGPGGKRPFVLKKFIPRQGSFYGIGLAEMLFGLNNELDMLHNMRLDNGTLMNLPFGFYRAASGLNPEKIDLGPGKLIPVDDPQGDVNFPRMNGGTGYGFQEEQAVTGYADKSSGINEIAMGSTTGQGAARTATGATILANAANAGIDIFIRRYQDGFKQNLHILDLQLADLLPLGTITRVVGQDGKDLYRQFTSRDSLRFEVDYCLEGNSANTNKLVERDVAMQMLQTMSNPLFLQGGLVGIKNLYNLAKNVLQKFEYRNVDAYITKPAEAEMSPYSPKDELSAILAGVKLPKVTADRHAEKLAFFQEFEDSDDFGLLDAEHLPLYSEYKNWHAKMAESMAANANNPLAQNQGVAPNLAAEIAAGAGGTLTGGPAQQIGDLVPQNSPLGA